MNLKIKNLNKIISDLSGRELDFYLYLIKRQNAIGKTDGVYYRDVMETLHMPRSTFYSILDELQVKGYIYLCDLNEGVGFNIYVIDNKFLDKSDYKEGYVNINLDFILSEEFILLNVNLKKFFLRLLSLQANRKSVKLLKDTLKGYKVNRMMAELGRMFNIVPDGDGYLFSIKPHLLKVLNNGKYLEYEQKLVMYCRNYNISYTAKELSDSIKTIINGVSWGRRKMAMIHKALDKIRELRRLQPKLITYMIYCNPYI